VRLKDITPRLSHIESLYSEGYCQVRSYFSATLVEDQRVSKEGPEAVGQIDKCCESDRTTLPVLEVALRAVVFVVDTSSGAVPETAVRPATVMVTSKRASKVV